MKFFIASPWQNKNEVSYLSNELKKREHQVYSFLDSGFNLLSGKPIEDEMQLFSHALTNWREEPIIFRIFNSEMDGLKNSEVVILLLPAGRSSHLETGVAYALGKKLILIGLVDKPEIVYLIFNEIYTDIDSFLKILA